MSTSPNVHNKTKIIFQIKVCIKVSRIHLQRRIEIDIFTNLICRCVSCKVWVQVETKGKPCSNTELVYSVPK